MIEKLKRKHLTAEESSRAEELVFERLCMPTMGESPDVDESTHISGGMEMRHMSCATCQVGDKLVETKSLGALFPFFSALNAEEKQLAAAYLESQMPRNVKIIARLVEDVQQGEDLGTKIVLKFPFTDDGIMGMNDIYWIRTFVKDLLEKVVDWQDAHPATPADKQVAVAAKDELMPG